MDDTPESSEQLAIERRRIEIEEARLRSETGFLRKNLALIITALASFAAVAVSAAQVYVAHQSLETARVQRDREIQLEQLEQDRRWSLDLADFILRHRNAIFSKKPEERARIGDVLAATFPPHVTETVFRRIAIAGSSADRPVWIEYFRAAQRVREMGARGNAEGVLREFERATDPGQR